MNTTTFATPPVELHWKLDVTGQTLTLRYEIENRSGERLYVIDALFQPSRQPVIDSSLAYTIVHGDTLMLFRGVLPIPEGLQVEAPDLPYARLLAAGGVLKGVIETPLPLRFHQPYRWNDKEELRTFSKLRLRIGYVVAAEMGAGTVPEPRTVGAAEVFRIGYRQAVSVQRFLDSTEAAQPVTLWIRP